MTLHRYKKILRIMSAIIRATTRLPATNGRMKAQFRVFKNMLGKYGVMLVIFMIIRVFTGFLEFFALGRVKSQTLF